MCQKENAEYTIASQIVHSGLHARKAPDEPDAASGSLSQRVVANAGKSLAGGLQ